MIFVFILFAVITAIALVSVDIIHAQVMRENTSFRGYTMECVSQDNPMICDGAMQTHMNTTYHMLGSMHDECGAVQDDMNMTGHMMGMR